MAVMNRVAILIFLTLVSFGTSAKSYLGIDVSHHQGKILWEEVSKENIDFVYIHRDGGGTYVYPYIEGK